MLTVTADVAAWTALEAKRAPAKRRVGKAVKGGPLESPIQRDIVKALRKLGYIVHHSPNGAPLGGDSIARAKQAAVLKADGRVEGWPDIVVIDQHGRHAYFEIKRPGGAVSDDQERVAAALWKRRVPMAFVSSLDGVLVALKTWGWQ
jgi:VRR-NUC domain